MFTSLGLPASVYVHFDDDYAGDDAAFLSPVQNIKVEVPDVAFGASGFDLDQLVPGIPCNASVFPLAEITDQQPKKKRKKPAQKRAKDAAEKPRVKKMGRPAKTVFSKENGTSEVGALKPTTSGKVIKRPRGRPRETHVIQQAKKRYWSGKTGAVRPLDRPLIPSGVDVKKMQCRVALNDVAKVDAMKHCLKTGTTTEPPKDPAIAHKEEEVLPPILQELVKMKKPRGRPRKYPRPEETQQNTAVPEACEPDELIE